MKFITVYIHVLVIVGGLATGFGIGGCYVPDSTEKPTLSIVIDDKLSVAKKQADSKPSAVAEQDQVVMTIAERPVEELNGSVEEIAVTDDIELSQEVNHDVKQISIPAAEDTTDTASGRDVADDPQWTPPAFGNYSSPHQHWTQSPDMEPVRKKHFSDVYTGTRYPVSELYDLVIEADKAGKKKVVIPPGIYFSNRKWGSHVSFKNLEDLEIEADGVVLLCNSPSRAVNFTDCKNVTLRGLVVDYTVDGLPFTQGTLIGRNGKNGIVKLHTGYPRLEANQKVRKIVGYNSGSLLLLERVPTQYGISFTVIDDETVEVKNLLSELKLGDYVTFVHRQFTPHGLNVNYGENIVIENVTLHTAPMFSVLDYGSKESVYRGVRITPGPMPDGATVPRLKSGVQDGIHIKDTKGDKGVVIEDCLIDSHCDDAIAINTPYSLIVEAGKNYVILAGKNGHMNLSNGDTVRYTRAKDMAVQGTLKITDVEYITDKTECARLQDIKMGFKLSSFLRGSALKQPKFWKVKLRGQVKLEVTDFLSQGSGNRGAIIRNNVIRNHRARGMMLKTSDVLIENNTVFHSQMSGITFSVEKHWMEADYGNNIIIRNNRFIDCGYGWYSIHNPCSAIINMVGMGDHGQFAPAGQYSNVVIENNLISGAHQIPFSITSAKDVTIRKNTINGSHFSKTSGGWKVGLNQSAMAWFKNCQNVDYSENIYSAQGELFQGKESAFDNVDN